MKNTVNYLITLLLICAVSVVFYLFPTTIIETDEVLGQNSSELAILLAGPIIVTVYFLKNILFES